MKYKPTASSAIEFASANKLEDWIHLFLCSEGDNKPFSDGLKLEPRNYYAPIKTQLNKFERCCGPEANMKWQVPEANFNKHVDGIASFYKTGNWDMPPFIVCRNGNEFELNDGNHRYEALKRLGIDKHWVIFWETQTD